MGGHAGAVAGEAQVLLGGGLDVDAAGAAALVLAGEALGSPKTADGAAEMVRVLRVARTSAVRAATRTACDNLRSKVGASTDCVAS